MEGETRPISGELDFWHDDERGTPNAFLRSALFQAVQAKVDREELKQVVIRAQQGISITYTGPTLDQYDLDIWINAVHTIRTEKLGRICVFHGYTFLAQMGRLGRGGNNYDALDRSLTRLASGVVEIHVGKSKFVGHLISSFLRDLDQQIFKISFDEEILDLFWVTGYTRLKWKEREALQGKPLALCLHGYFSSHTQPYPVTAEYLHKLSGSKIKHMFNFRQKLKKACNEVVEATNGRITLLFDGEKISVQRAPEPAKIE